jgi:nucleoside-diphosphate-sugar epimerase
VVNGDGLQSRDFTYVDNVVVANLLALAAEGLAGQAVNIATAERITLLELLTMLGEECGAPIEPRHAAARPGDVRHSLADISLAYELLGYRPVVDLRTGLRRTLEWQRARRARAFRAAS